MPLGHHPIFIEPQDDALLWRYMNFAKFVSMVTTKALWFSNMSALAADDPFEGGLPKGNFSHRDWNSPEDVPSEELDRISKTLYEDNSSIEMKIKCLKNGRDDLIRNLFLTRKELFINCWHSSEHESMSMWHEYAENNFGIAVTAIFSDLRKSISNCTQEIFAGSVNYIDYENHTLDLSNGFAPTVHKRKSFEHEREVRLLHWDTELGEEQVLCLWNGQPRIMTQQKPHEELEKMIVPVGVNINCELSNMIRDIRISPTAPSWFEDAVRSFCELSNLDKPVIRSDLARAPLW
jgi:Protein of unknown function (DUF2971)